jgi:hypothetical protein
MALAMGVASCQSARDKAFSTYLPRNGDVNSTITLEEAEWLFGKSGNLTKDPTLDFMLINHGSKSVALPYNFGTRVFIYSREGRSWTEIKDGSTYLPPQVPVILQPVTESGLNWEVVGPWPIGEGLETASHLRVLVSGNLLGDDGELGEEVVAYVEIELQH